MLTRERAIQLLKSDQAYLRAEYGVGRIGLFGSLASGRFNDSSDVDVIVEFERPIGLRFVEFVEYLEKLLGRPVDVLTPAGIENIRVMRVADHITESIVYV